MSDIQTDPISMLRSLINGTTLTCRTGIVLLPPRRLGSERNLAVDFQADFVDYRHWRLARMQPESNFLNLTANTLAADLSALSQGEPERSSSKRSVVVANLDLALTYLPFEERDTVWRYLREQMRRRPVGLIIALPNTADKVLPSGRERDLWLESQRLITLP